MDSIVHPAEAFQLHTKGISQDWPEAGRICLSYGCTGCTEGFHFQKYDAMIFIWAAPMLAK